MYMWMTELINDCHAQVSSYPFRGMHMYVCVCARACIYCSDTCRPHIYNYLVGKLVNDNERGLNMKQNDRSLTHLLTDLMYLRRTLSFISMLVL